METNCAKCGYLSKNNLEKFKIPICNICLRFAPNNEDLFKKYIEEKINSENLESFRKFSEIGRPQKNGMIKKAKKGNLMSRAPFGYKIQNKKLILDENNYREVEKIFEDFLKTEISLNKLAKKYKFSINGLKKILRNFTYVGKIKFNGQIYEGTHKQIVSSTLFNHVQNKLEKLKIK